MFTCPRCGKECVSHGGLLNHQKWCDPMGAMIKNGARKADKARKDFEKSMSKRKNNRDYASFLGSRR